MKFTPFHWNSRLLIMQFTFRKVSKVWKRLVRCLNWIGRCGYALTWFDRKLSYWICFETVKHNINTMKKEKNKRSADLTRLKCVQSNNMVSVKVNQYYTSVKRNTVGITALEVTLKLLFIIKLRFNYRMNLSLSRMA